MIAISSAYIAIANAANRGVLRLEPVIGRNGDYVAICDEVGIIEAAASAKEAGQIVDAAIEAAGGYITFDDLPLSASVGFDSFAQG